MEILKNSENYTINGTLENGWSVNGGMSVSDSNISINLNLSSKDEEVFSEVGNYYWNKTDNRVNANYSTANPSNEKALIDASLAIIAEALEAIED